MEKSNIFQIKIGHRICQKKKKILRKRELKLKYVSLVQKCKDVHEFWEEEYNLKARRAGKTALCKLICY